jgi:hypothetical protein
LAELQSSYPAIARRTLQRHIAKLIDAGQSKAVGEGRARRYFVFTLNPIAVAT